LVELLGSRLLRFEIGQESLGIPAFNPSEFVIFLISEFEVAFNSFVDLVIGSADGADKGFLVLLTEVG